MLKRRVFLTGFILVFLLLAVVGTRAGVICQWNMDDGSGQKLADFSGKGFDGTFVQDGADCWVSGVSGKAIRLTGGSGCVQQIGLLDEAMPEGTISFWARFDRPNTPEHVLDKLNDETNNSEDQIQIIKRADNHIEYWSQMSGYGTSLPLISVSEVFYGEWMNITVTWGSAGRRLYIDGALEALDTYPASFGAGKLSQFCLGKGVSASFDKLVVFNTCEDIRPTGNQVEVKLVKAEYKSSYHQGDIAAVNFYFKVAKPQKGRAKAIVALHKNDRTVIRKAVTFSVNGLKPGEIKRVEGVKFDLCDAPQGNNALKLSGLATKILGVSDGGTVGNIKVSGHR